MLDGDLFFEDKDSQILYYYKREEASFSLPFSELVETTNEDNADIFLFKNGFNYINSDKVLFNFQDLTLNMLLSNTHFYRALKRNEKSKASLARAYEELGDSEIFNYFIFIFSTIRDIFNREDDDEVFLNEVFKVAEFKNNFETLIVSKDIAGNVLLDEKLCLCFGDFYILCSLKEQSENSVMTWDLINLTLFELFKEGRVLAQENMSVVNYSNLSYITSKLEYPVAILNKEGSVVLFNDHFSSLNILPSNLLDYDDDDWIDINGSFHKVRKNNIDSIGSVYVLTLSKKQEGIKIDNQSELGIITGSIAHELNNPVAGILAAVTILEFEEWDDDNLKLLNDLKDSAVRCKELVDTFLGFSRYKVRDSVVKCLGGIIDQAISLLRFRVIESGLHINVEIDDESRDIECKAVVLPMVMYLLFGELLTLLSHKKLIDESINKTLCLEAKINGDNLSVKIKSFSLSTSDRKSLNQKLIIHLLEMDNIELRISEDGLELSTIAIG